MTQTTACPQCKTRFRVTAEQLAARGGDVRCGCCTHVFNAYETLVEEIPAPELPQEIEAPEQQTAPEEAPEFPYVAEETTDEIFPAAEAEALPQEETPAEIESAAEPAPPSEAPQAEAAAESELEFTPEIRVARVQSLPQKIEPAVSPKRPKYGPPPKPKRAWPWVLGSLLLLMGLAGQGAYLLRDSIAANYPPTRPILEQACAYLHCRVSLPQKPDLLSIESSELHADPARASIVVLTSTLRNRAPHVQAYPVLELTLTNTKDEMVARRVFTPKEYLPNPAVITQGIPAKGDIAVKLLMDLGDLKAEGYRLYLFFPGNIS